MKNKLLFILIPSIVIIGIILLFIFFRRNSNNPTVWFGPTPTTFLNNATPTVSVPFDTSQDKVIIPSTPTNTISPTGIPVNNFLKSPITVANGDVLFVDKSNAYQILYRTEENYFLISILGS